MTPIPRRARAICHLDPNNTPAGTPAITVEP
jgi:hypothetical protein